MRVSNADTSKRQWNTLFEKTRNTAITRGAKSKKDSSTELKMSWFRNPTSREEQRRRNKVSELVTTMLHDRAARWLTERVASKVASQESFIASFEAREGHSLAQTLDRDLPRCHFNVVEFDGQAIAGVNRKEKVQRCRSALEKHSKGPAKPLVLMANQGLFGVFLEALHDQFPPHDEFGPVPTPGSHRGPRFEVDLAQGKLLASAACDLRLLGHDRGVFVATYVCDFVVDAQRRAVVVRCRRTDDFRSTDSFTHLVNDVARLPLHQIGSSDPFFSAAANQEKAPFVRPDYLDSDDDVDARLAFSFDRTLRIVDIYINSPLHEIYAIQFSFRCAFPVNNKISSKTIGKKNRDRAGWSCQGRRRDCIVVLFRSLT